MASDNGVGMSTAQTRAPCHDLLFIIIIIIIIAITIIIIITTIIFVFIILTESYCKKIK